MKRIASLVALIWSLVVAQSRADLTFFTCSDTHYRGEVASNATKTATVDLMNALPGKPYPADLGGGTVGVPRGVIVPGDLIDHGQAPAKLVHQEWALWTADFGLHGEGRLKFPTYEGYGNHDYNEHFYVENEIKARNLARSNVVAIASNGYHYAWEWDGIHFIQLNLYPGTIRPKGAGGQSPRHALEFLRDELKKDVGTSGRAVIVSFHYQPTDTWWTDEEKQAFYDAIHDYNVILIIHGHQGRASIADWKGLTVLDNNDFFSTGFFIVHIDNGNHMRIVQRTRSDQWGLSLKKVFTNPKSDKQVKP